MSETRFIHLRIHSSYSLCEGAIHLKNLPKLCTENSMPAVALTDTNNIFGAPLFSKVCLADGVQPILGTQINIKLKKKKEAGFSRSVNQETQTAQLVLLVQNEAGYQSLNNLFSTGYDVIKRERESFYLDLDELAKNNEGLICLTGGHNGLIGKLLLENREELAEENLLKLKEIFNDRLYIEVQRHGLEIQNKTEPKFIEWAYKHNLPLVATNEVFFKSKKEYEAHDALLCVKDGRYVDEDDRRKETKEHYFKSQDEMVELFADLPEAIENTVAIAKRCGYAVPTRDPLLPHISKDEDETLKNDSAKGLTERLQKLNITDTKPYFDQLEYELSVIKGMGFPGYFLIVAEFIEWSRKENIPVGPGRGSGAGSVVAWSLGITNVNPREYGLLFERFLNPDRISMPDFDIDFCQERRLEVIKHVQVEYGAEKVAQIITFGELKARGVLRDVGRVLRMPYPQVDTLCKFIPGGPADKMTLAEALNLEKFLRKEYSENEIVKKCFDIAMTLEGLHRHSSVHAAGVVIGDRPLNELVSLYNDPRADMPVSQYNMKFIDDTGLVKYDFLGLKTLTVIQKTVEKIKENHNVDIDIDDLPLDDSAVYKIYANGDTVGLFQFESKGMQESLKALKPTEINDLVAMVSLYRPGPMENIPTYVDRKHGKEEITYLHPLMAKALKETYGIIVYQEQVMEMSKVLAGFTGGQADTLRKAMGKKIQKLMDELKPLFVNGCEKNGITTNVSTEIWELMEKFASYGFNKSHAVCYALISYQTGYLKTHYRAEFMASLMELDLDNTDKLAEFVKDIKKSNVELIPPNVNTSEEVFKAENGKIYYALGALKNVGKEAMSHVVAERKENGDFKDIPDFIARVNPKDVNKRTLENLIKSGSLDSLDPDRATLLKNLNLLLANMGSINKQKETGESSLFGVAENTSEDTPTPPFYQNIKKAEPFSVLETINFETEALGFYFTNHPLRRFSKLFKKMTIKSSKDFESLADNQTIKLPVFVDSFSVRRTKSDKKMGVLCGSDSFNAFEVLFFSKDLEQAERVIKPKTAILLSINIRKDKDQITCFGGGSEPLMNHIFQCLTKVVLPIEDKKILPKISTVLNTAKKGYTTIMFNLKSKKQITNIRLPNQIRLTEQIFDTLEKYIPELEMK